jgi:hypothetical protein
MNSRSRRDRKLSMPSARNTDVGFTAVIVLVL